MSNKANKVACLKSKKKTLVKAIESEIKTAKEMLEVKSYKPEDHDEIIEEFSSQATCLTELEKKLQDLTNEITEELEDEDAEVQCDQDGTSAMTIGVATVKMCSRIKTRLEKLKNEEITRRNLVLQEKKDDEVGGRSSQGAFTEQKQLIDDTTRRSSFFGRSSQIRLPKIDFAIFTGEMMKWPEFWDSFEAAVDYNDDLQAVEKLSYLRSKIAGEALNVIQGLPTTNDNYNVAVSLLKSRYGNTQLLITTHYSKMMELPRAVNVTSKIRELHDEWEKHLRSLEALGEDTSHRHFISLIMAKLPWQVVAKLEESRDGEEPWTVLLLRKKLQNQLAAREAADRQCPTKNYDYSENRTKHVLSQRELRQRGTAEALFAGDRRPFKDTRTNRMPTTIMKKSLKCIFCSGNHYNDECRVYTTLDSRKSVIKGRCYICLSDQHLLRFCNMKNRECVHCGNAGNHHRSLCPEQLRHAREVTAMVPESPTQDIDEDDNTSQTDKALLASGENVLLQTAICTVEGGLRSLQVRILLDSGSHRSYISEKLAKKLNLERSESESVSVVTFGSNKPKTIETGKAKIILKSATGFSKAISVNIVPQISGNISRAPVQFDKEYHLWKNFSLADTLPRTTEVSSIDCLIGSDYYMDLVTNEKLKMRDGLYLLGSRFGWILTGRTGHAKDNVDASLFINSQVNAGTVLPKYDNKLDACLPVSPNMEDMWQLETIGITDQIECTDDDDASKQFSENIRYQDGRYYVGWPKKEDYNGLQDNFGLAYGRFKTTCRRLASNPDLLRKYDVIIKDQEKKGVVEKVNTSNRNDKTTKHYIPHHPVITTKKIRIVYDASAKANKSDKSLNEYLLRVPIMLQDLCGLLLRLRLHTIVILADIEKAFLQVGLHPDDRDVTRFFWLKDIGNTTPENNTQVYRFCRVPFGVISSPFLLAATVKHHLSSTGSKLAEKICQDLYVDNVVTGVENSTEAEKLYKEAKQLFHKASMNLREWSSNDETFVKSLPNEDKLGGEYVKVLGLKWNTIKDTLQLTSSKDLDEYRTATKRIVLKGLAVNFDPLGLFAPVILSVKILLQKIWEANYKWDELLPNQIQKEWKV